MAWETVQEAFRSDGALRDLYVFDTTAADWDAVLTALPGWGYRTEYSVDGVPRELPGPAEQAFAVRPDAASLMAVQVDSVRLNSHFFSEAEIEFDLNPAEVRGAVEFSAVTQFMARVGQTLKKPVVLTLENMREAVIVKYTPGQDQFDYHEVTWE